MNHNLLVLFYHFSKKTALSDLIPPDHVDIHSHLLPGIDDGAKDIEQSAFLLSELTQIGVTEFITTPHILHQVYDNTPEGIQNTLITTQSSLPTKYKLRAAAEYMMDSNFNSLIKSAPLLTLKDNIVLVEMSYINPPMQLYDFIFDLQIAGYIPMLAHPERYSFYHHKFDEFKKLKNAGCKFQINLLSCTGYYGSSVLECSKKLLKSGMIDFSGSDVHHKQHIASFKNKVLIKDIAPLKDAMQNNIFFR
ncbi:MAG TPA: CpsB/CapC family capsule biosynthesis tyrosine phosphatase [Flavobacterium sp.]